MDGPLLPDFSATIPAFLHRIAERFGDAEAFVRDGRRISFRDLERQSRDIAKGLLALGVTKGSRIAILLPPVPEFVVFLMAAGRIGAIAAPVSTLYQAPELRWVLAHSEIEHLVTADRFLKHDYLARLEAALPELASAREPGALHVVDAPRLRAIHVWGQERRAWTSPAEAIARAGATVTDALLEAVERLVAPADPLLMIHTSGTTSAPKAIIHGHGPVIRHSYQMAHRFYPFGPGDRVITPRALFWIAGLIATLFYSLQAGSCLISTSDTAAANVARLIEQEGANALAGDHAWFAALREAPDLQANGLNVVRLNTDMAAISRRGDGAEAFLSAHLRQRFGAPRHDPHERFALSYGMTESLGAHTSIPVETRLPEGLPAWQGQPVPGVDLRIVDPQTREPLPAGAVGELMIRGYCLMQGVDKRERTEVFDAEGFYPTGDLCHVDGRGYLKFVSRANDMLKVHGANVAPPEVEAVLAGVMGIEKVAVLGLPDGDDTFLVAVVEMADGRPLDEAGVIAHARTQLSSFKVPCRVIAMDPEDIPYTGSGKVRKAELARIVAERLGRGEAAG